MISYQNFAKELEDGFGECSDLIRLDFDTGGKSAAVFFLDGFVEKLLFENNILRPMKALEKLDAPYLDTVNAVTMLTTPIELLDTASEAASRVAQGEIVLVIDGAEGIFMFSEKQYKTRGIQEPPVSNVLRGPREGFVEDFKTNITMLRRRLASPDLRLENMRVGKYTSTAVCVAYLDGVAENAIVEEVKNRLKRIDMDGIIESSYIARFLEDHKYSLFSQVGATEKPDIVTGKLLEGRVAIIVDGSPTVLTVPFVLYEHFQASEDYYIKSYRASLIRIVRGLAMLIAVLLPAVYVALQQFQYQMFPLKFLISVMNSIYGIPFTPVLEMLTVLVIFEILNEAGVRMPRYVGMALSVVGAIVLGETAVSAGLFSTPAILVIAVSTIGLYCVPDEANAGSVLRVVFVAVAGVLGMLGIILLCAAIVAYLAGIKSYGTSYLAPFAPALLHDWQDGALKGAVSEMNERPYTIPTRNRTRIKHHAE